MPLPRDVIKVNDALWEIPKSYKSGMRVPVRVFATEKLLKEMDQEVFNQITNVARLPGITGYAFCMPDGHSGYGFPIGGTAAFDTKKGIISPGGIGFDVNCGMRLVHTSLTLEEVKPKIKQLIDRLFKEVPTGVGRSSSIKMSRDDFRAVLGQGARWCVKKGYGWKQDLERTEDMGCVSPAKASKISPRSIERGYKQLGTLGSGNHYLEIQVAAQENIFDSKIARKFGIRVPDQIMVMFHCGSRGFGHQMATDYLQKFLNVMQKKYNLPVTDRELACAPFSSPEGQDYFQAMNCAINMAFANRQMILHRIREVFSEVFRKSPEDLGLYQIYDVAHNTAKLEKHSVNGEIKEVLIHRKGATRAFGPGMPGLPEVYYDTGQPVIIGGSMETGSYLLAGTAEGQNSFYTTAHGSGRTMSRRAAKKKFRGEKLIKEMEKKGVYVHTASFSSLAEEAGAAYKNIDDVVEATEIAGISRRVARFIPIGNVKG
ncbi:MAG: RtcB family protein [Spirochaetota bacterium]